MRIGLDLVNLRSLVDGVGRFTRELLAGLAAFDQDNEYWLFVSENIFKQLPVAGSQFHRCVANNPLARFLPKNQVYFALQSALLPRLDILHSPVSVAPFVILPSWRRIVTVHDLAFKANPETVTLTTRLWQNSAWPLCVRQVDHIVASSTSTKNDLMKFYRVPEDKISVVHLCVSWAEKPAVERGLPEIRDRYGLPARFIMHVGTPHRRKNILGLIRAFHLLKTRSALPHKLVLVGPVGWAGGPNSAAIGAEIRKFGLEADILVVGHVPDEELAVFYAAADLFVYPSFYEGFGLPPLEAMASGTPVVVSRTSSLPEVVGPAGLYFDPTSPDDIAEKISQVLTSSELSGRLKALGRERVRQFSLERMARAYLAVYQAVGNRRR